MRIGFDAKRAFFNSSGLGNYSRSLISALTTYFAEENFILYTPKPKKSNPFVEADNICIKGPDSYWSALTSSFWRTFGILKQLKNDKIDVYHGLSNELPAGIKDKIPSVVTIHDLIFVNHPHLYKRIDRYIYKKKLFHAVNSASVIIATSNQTKEDIVAYCRVPDKKVRVVYQGCNELFWNGFDQNKNTAVFRKYKIPDEFILNVGTIERRKNILSVIKALHEKKLEIPLVVIGRQTAYVEEINAYIEQNLIKNVYFLHDVPLHDLPSFYQNARLFVYPSFYEGFGIPILEALVSRTPVITTRGGCFSEVGGPNSVYVDPQNTNELGDSIVALMNNEALCNDMREKGFEYAQKFRAQNFASEMMKVYQSIV